MRRVLIEEEIYAFFYKKSLVEKQQIHKLIHKALTNEISRLNEIHNTQAKLKPLKAVMRNLQELFVEQNRIEDIAQDIIDNKECSPECLLEEMNKQGYIGGVYRIPKKEADKIKEIREILKSKTGYKYTNKMVLVILIRFFFKHIPKDIIADIYSASPDAE